MAGRLFWAITVGFLLGVFARSLLPLSGAFIWFIVAVSLAMLATAYLGREKSATAILIAVAFISCSLGIARMGAATLMGDPLLSAHLNESLTIEGKAVAEPDVREGSVRISVGVSAIILGGATSSLTKPVGVLVVAPAHTEISYGDTIRATGIVRAPKAFDTGEGREFAYPEYLAMQGIEYELSRAEIEARQEHTGNPIKAFAINLKRLFLSGLSAALPEPAAGLAGGITVGDKRSIGKELTEDFQTVGLIHVIVLSGYNITIVLNAAAWLITRTPGLRHVRLAQLGVSGIIVTLFVLMSGGASSAARAGAMALIGVYARTSGRVFLALRALAAAAVIIILWNPFTLGFDPGFQLSMIATLGLITFTPLFADRLQWIPKRFLLREIAASTLGTQLAVLPLLLYQNGALSIYALPANLLTLMFVPYSMLFSLIAGVAGVLLGPFAIPIALPAYLLLEYVISVARIIADLPYAAISIGVFSPIWLFAGYVALFGAAACFWRKRAGLPEEPRNTI